MTYTVEIAPAAQRDIKRALKRLSKKDVQAIFDAISDLSITPRPKNVEKISGGNSLYRLRIGNYRIVYQVRDNEVKVLILVIGDRKDVYDQILDKAQSRIKGHEK